MSTRSTRNTPRPKRAPRSKAPEPTPVPVPAPEPAPAKPSYARGNPLTHSVTFTDMGGTCWLVYVEPAPPEPALWPNAAVIPGRRLRFDSVDRSVTVSPFPAGAPFLQERTLQNLLDQTQTQTRTTVAASTPAPAPPERAAAPVAPARPVATAPRRTISPKAMAPVEPPAEPMRNQLASVVSSRSGVTYQLSRLVQPFALVLMVIKDMILPRGRG
jgi:hypothetical protein